MGVAEYQGRIQEDPNERPITGAEPLPTFELTDEASSVVVKQAMVSLHWGLTTMAMIGYIHMRLFVLRKKILK
jgi:hypothetical protein